MRILIVNFGTKRNLGCYALLEGTIALLRRACPGAEIRVLAFLDNDDVSGVRIIRSPVFARPGPKGKIENVLDVCAAALGTFASRNRLSRLCFSRRRREQRELLESYHWADIVVNTGGDVLTEDYGTYSLSLNLFHLFLALMARKRIVFVGETIGPFHNPISLRATLVILRRSKLVLVRESMTEKYLQSLDVSPSPLFRIPDPSLAIANPPRTGANQPRNLPDTRPRICVAPSALAWRYFESETSKSSDAYGRYIDFLVEVCEFFTIDAGGEVVLMPHVTGDAGPDDDLTVCRDILDRMNDRSRARILEDVETPQAVRRLLSDCSFLVAFRMHAAIAGYATETPTVSVGYSSKFEGMAVDIMGSAEWFIDVRKLGLNQQGTDSILGRIGECWKNRSDAESILSKRMRGMKDEMDCAVLRLKAVCADDERNSTED